MKGKKNTPAAFQLYFFLLTATTKLNSAVADPFN